MTSGFSVNAIQLPYDSHRTSLTGRGMARFAFPLEVSARPGVSPQALLSAAFGILLARYSGQTRIEMARADLDIELESTGEQILKQAEAESLRVRRSSLADAVWTLSEVEDDEGEGEGQWDLRLLAKRGFAELRYNRELFKSTTIERMARHLRLLLAQLTESPDLPVNRLRLVDAEERAKIESACDGVTHATGADLIIRQFESYAAKDPDAVAVRYRDRRMTYGELNSRANWLAARLIDLGVGAESYVVVSVRPSFEIAVALLAIHKAGAVYVPLEPTYPAARIQSILDDLMEDLTAPVILSQGELIATLGLEKKGAPTIDLDRMDWPAHPQPNLGIPLTREQTAYIYYTSGTTGKPKGVMASQGNLLAYIAEARARYGIHAGDTIPAVARFSFSISMFELMSPLSAGGQLLVLDREHITDTPRMAATLAEVTFFHIGPSLLKGLLAEIRAKAGPSADFSGYARVRHASSGGDMVPPEVLESLKEIFPAAEVFVIYGCSEISCMGCTYPAPRDQTIRKTFVGRPFDNMSVRILDASLAQVPVGVIGEICFAGEGIAKGYLNRPELTAEKFVLIEGRRFYCTGDVGRLSEEGWVEILGRSDFQVKLRGMRVELAEVDYHLRRAPGVKDAVAMAKDGPGGERILVGYVVTDGIGNESDRMSAIRASLAASLPDYMVPSAYVELERLPLNHNLKVDRHALPSLSDVNAGRASPMNEPNTATERRLAELWSKCLGLERVGRDDYFSELGGYSLLALRLIDEIESELGVRLDGMEVLRLPLSILARLCDERAGRAASLRPAPQAAHERVRTRAFYFGPGQRLYGVLTEPVQPVRDDRAVVICQPVGVDQVQTQFIVRQLARKLAEAGVASLRFDFSGSGDSLGEIEELTELQWLEDVSHAYDELKSRSGARRLIGIGVRLGALLLDLSPQPWERIVLWDPPRSGDAYLEELKLTQAHCRKSMRDLRFWWPAPKRAGTGHPGREWVGAFYSEPLQVALRGLVLSPVGGPRRVQAASSELGLSCDWKDISRIEQILPDTGVSRALARLALGEGTQK